MDFTTSADGTRIAYETYGSGPPVIIVNGALSTGAASAPLAEALAAAGFTAVAYDRRARNESGDTLPYAPEREVEDLRAVVEAVGGSAAILGHSSGAVLGLLAASQGLAATHLFLSEPPLRFGPDPRSGPELARRLQDLVDAGRDGDAVLGFLRDNVQLPEPAVEQFKNSPGFAATTPLAQSTVYDTLLVASVAPPSEAMLAVTVPVTILRGEPTYPFLVDAANRLAAAIPTAELVVVPESQHHGLDPAGTTREVRARL